MARQRRTGPVCGRCKRPVILALVDGAWVKLDPTPREPEAGLIGYNPGRETGRELVDEDLPHPAWAWAYAGATFHERHALVCGAVVGARVGAGQARLGRLGPIGTTEWRPL